MVSCEFCEISKNTVFTEHLWATASAHENNLTIALKSLMTDQMNEIFPCLAWYGFGTVQASFCSLIIGTLINAAYRKRSDEDEMAASCFNNNICDPF